MPNRRIGSYDTETGEPVEEGVLVWFPGKRRISSPYGREWMQVNQNALAEIAADRDMGAEALRVFLYLNSRLDFDNLILVPQVEIAAALGMKPPSVHRAVKILTGKQIILRGPKLNGVSSFKLNEHYGWKGKFEDLNKAREARLRVIGREAGPDVLSELENTP